MGEAACSDRSRRRLSNRQPQRNRSESPISSQASPISSRGSSRSRSPSARRSVGRESSAGRRMSRRSSQRTSGAHSIQEEDEDLYG